ncbi:MAG TPA: histidine kinase [Thiobacillaceae bacterium]|nr:histidine kinase [Thiobacillaceae bacterium]HNU65221.1 histidine kinase [Thiobacillaceae bacterium]
MPGPAPEPAPRARKGPPPPDFRNLGTLLRVILLAEGAGFVYHLARQGSLGGALLAMTNDAPMYQTALLGSLLLLFLASPWLMRLPFVVSAGLGSLLTALTGMATQAFFVDSLPELYRGRPLLTGFLATVLAALIYFYFHWRQLSLSPALSDARLMALQARIRPHFLFNSLNSVLGLMRQNPGQAETVLENLADLFRALMADTRALVPLERELELARAYVQVETLRLGERLRLAWHCDTAPGDALVPQLILQPLIENAVMHGVEPSPGGGEVHVNLFVRADRLLLVVRNPLAARSGPRGGNRIALANIRERLDLHFDAEGRMTHFVAGGEFVVQIEMPLRRGNTTSPVARVRGSPD